MTTVKDLIEQLSEIEDKAQPIVFQYWLADDFEFHDGKGSPSQEQFAEAVDGLHADSLWEDAREIINDEVYEVVSRDFVEEDEDEDE